MNNQLVLTQIQQTVRGVDIIRAPGSGEALLANHVLPSLEVKMLWLRVTQYDRFPLSDTQYCGVLTGSCDYGHTLG